TNNPRKVKALGDAGVTIEERVAIEVGRNPHNNGYLNTKASKLGHYLSTHQDDEPEA
ncbi:MAG: GTP cyclohydrolase II, partial [Pseudomonadota bacterium]|nr:GTP cyclohydrolase II [Pseudomonadota bacterium]